MNAIFSMFLIAATATMVSSSVAPEKDLAKHLIATAKEAGLSGRPVKNPSDGVRVDVGLTLFRVDKADKDSLTVQGFLALKWNDPFLKWEPSDYAGAQTVTLPASSIWKPDVTLFHDMHQTPAELRSSMESFDALVMQDGTVYWIPRVTLQSGCKNEKCSFVFGSWAHDAKQMDVHFDNDKADIDMSAFEENPSVTVVSHSAKLEDKEYDCCPGTKYRSLTFTLGIKRNEHCDSKSGSCN